MVAAMTDARSVGQSNAGSHTLPSTTLSPNHPQSEEEYKHVVENHRLPNGLLFGLPVVFDTSREDIKPGQVRRFLLILLISDGSYTCLYIID